MAITFYEVSVPVYRQLLKALTGVLDKAEQHFSDQGVDPAEIFGTRLFEDMQPLSFQIAQAIGHSVGALALIRGQRRERAAGLDNFAAAKRAVEEALSELDSIEPSELEDAGSRPVELKFPGRELKFTGLGYLLSFALPQFYFHVTTAYDILRHKGVPIGKRDYLGRIQLVTS